VNRRRLILAGGILLTAAVMAYLLQDVIQTLLIVPLSFLWWLLTIVYEAIAQIIFWTLLVIAVGLMAFSSFYGRFKWRRSQADESRRRPGPVQLLAGQIKQSRTGDYHKWFLAHRLGELARAIIRQREGEEALPVGARLDGRDWNPSPHVREYLENGLNRSFTDFLDQKGPQLPFKWLSHPVGTPLDQEVEPVVDFLENEMETNSDRRRS
jgi:hypothetical protein